MPVATPAIAPDDFSRQAGRSVNMARRAVQNASSYSGDASSDVSGIQAFPDEGQAYSPPQDTSDAGSV